MEIPNSYMEDEVRNGFFVPSIMKRAWAVELQVLNEVDKVCQRHGISWFADWGTLLGAVRHQGFVPWDDDVDIVMLREDYERFLQVSHELPEGYKILNIRNQKGFWYFLARVVAKPRICFEEEHLKEYNGFPYIAGIDIFVRDYISEDVEKEETYITTAKYVLSVADAIGTPEMQPKKLEDHLVRIEEICGLNIERLQDKEALKTQLYLLVEQLISGVREEESLLITQKIPYAIERQERRWMPKEWYSESIRMPFEYTSIPVPIEYKQVLYREYGDYMKPVQWTGGTHSYPFFRSQREQLEEILDFPIPGYYFSKEMMKRQQQDKKDCLKKNVLFFYKELEDMFSQIKRSIKFGSKSELEDLLIHSQQKAIELGTLIDRVKGDGLKTVGILEEYCEFLFQLYQILDENEEQKCILMDEKNDYFQKLEKSIYLEIIDKKEIVFLSYRAKSWNTWENLYKKAMADPQWDVYVISVPYYEKNYLGEFSGYHNDVKELAQKVSVSEYDSFDFHLHCPECIVIQNPYDEYNMAVSVDRGCYSKTLQGVTECLLYIPYFEMDEFQKGDAAWSMMQYYCNMPGVISADKVFVQSKNMRQLYIDKLTEFAGEETREIWENKIFDKAVLDKGDLSMILKL